MTSRLTLMTVHAHPDDEAIGTGGILAGYAERGVRTILVTCTNGELGDAPGGVKPGEPGHDEAEVVALRRRELEASCRVLGVSHLEVLGYHDSGMMGWPANDAPGAFWRTPVDGVAARVGALMERYRPQVVVTYDERGFYGHPDHIQAHRATMAAARATGIPDKVYYTAVPRSAVTGFADVLRRHGVEPPPDMADQPELGTPDEDIGAVIDCSAVAARKYESLEAHASQSENIFFLRLGREVFSSLFGTEAFVRAVDRTGEPLPEDDLFAGVGTDGPGGSGAAVGR
ncbi:MAG: PIG-L family deacetylase [Acidimicrobiales bacterium]